MLASTLTYWMDQAIQLGAAGDEEAEAVAEDGAMANFLQGMRQAPSFVWRGVAWPGVRKRGGNWGS